MREEGKNVGGEGRDVKVVEWQYGVPKVTLVLAVKS